MSIRMNAHRPMLEMLEDRLALNNRFVVPLAAIADNATTFHSLYGALYTPGLASGDIVQIEAGSVPGPLADILLPAVKNLTIRGAAGIAPSDRPLITTAGEISVDAAQEGLVLDRLNLVLDDALTFNTNAVLSNCTVTTTSEKGIALKGTTAAALLNNNIVCNYFNLGGVIQVATAPGAHNLILDNTIRTTTTGLLIYYSGANTITDLVKGNTFVGNEMGEAVSMLIVAAGVDGLTIQNNIFRDKDFSFQVIHLNPGARNIAILDNVIDLADGSDGRAIFVGNGSTGIIIARNQIRAGTSEGILFDVIKNPIRAKVEGNIFLKSKVGVRILSGGGSIAGIDLGGGSQGSLGANNFRVFTSPATPGSMFVLPSGAIVVIAAPDTVSAKGNLFAEGNPETFVYDKADDAIRADAVTSESASGNAAYVQALYLKFLHRIGDVDDAGDAGNWVTLLDGGASTQFVASAIMRSAEALGVVVDDLYRDVLRRQSDANRQGWIDTLAAGVSLQKVQTLFIASPEYRDKFGSDRAFVTSLYADRLGRAASQDEVASWLAALSSVGREAIVDALLSSPEHRAFAVGQLYAELLKRSSPPATAEVGAWLNSGLELLDIALAIAASQEAKATL